VKLTAAIIVTAVGFFATVTASAGPTLTLAVLTLAAGAGWFANALMDRMMP
jgi:hypothetical protein